MPPRPGYELGDENAACRTMDGLGTVVYSRKEAVSGPTGIPACDRGRAFADWLASYGGDATADVRAFVTRTTAHRWRGGARLRNDVRDDRRTCERLHAAMMRELRDLGVLTAGDARRAAFHFDVELLDDRGDRTRALPTRASLLSPDTAAN